MALALRPKKGRGKVFEWAQKYLETVADERCCAHCYHAYIEEWLEQNDVNAL